MKPVLYPVVAFICEHGNPAPGGNNRRENDESKDFDAVHSLEVLFTWFTRIDLVLAALAACGIERDQAEYQPADRHDQEIDKLINCHLAVLSGHLLQANVMRRKLKDKL